MAESFPWTCPYCNRDATITKSNFSTDMHQFSNDNKDGVLGIYTETTVCPNKACREYSIFAALYKREVEYGAYENKGKPILTWTLRPQSNAKPYPDYIPEAIRQDYQEACLVQNLSPKASATLSRRCLQGIIRDYWEVKKGRLLDEINAIQSKVDPLTWQAIDSVRSIGNIGAHMEKDINLLIEVEPEEARLLIGLIELLLRDWYIARHERENDLKAIVRAAGSKKQAKQSNKPIKPTQ